MVTRREFLVEASLAAAAVAGAAAGLSPVEAAAPSSSPAPAAGKPRVVVIRHDVLAADGNALTPPRVRELLDEAARALEGDSRAADAWARWFKPTDRVGIKVNCLAYATHPAVAEALAQAIPAAGLAPDRIILWDRSNRELKAAGYDVRDAAGAVRCFGTDTLAARGSGGYAADLVTSGAIGSLFSRIVTDETTTIVSAPILKDHNLAGLSGGMKNLFGAIHNPNKYHDHGCDPFVADVCAAAPIHDRLRLVVCDATWPQYHGGPSRRKQWQWPYGGLILGTDPVAVDRVALEILARRRAAVGMKPLEGENRPVLYLASAEARGLGAADLAKIEVIGIGKAWTDVA